MIMQKIPSEPKIITKVTSIQLSIMFLVMGIVAGVFASLLLGVQGRLRGGMGFWYAYLVGVLTVCAGLGLGYLKFKNKPAKLSLPPKI